MTTSRPCARPYCRHMLADHGTVYYQHYGDGPLDIEREVDPPCRMDGCRCDYYLSELPRPERIKAATERLEEWLHEYGRGAPEDARYPLDTIAKVRTMTAILIAELWEPDPEPRRAPWVVGW